MSKLVPISVELDGSRYELLTAGAVNDEPLVKDLELARWLGFGDIHKIRELIGRWSHEIGVSATVAETPGGGGGRPGRAYYLTEPQALFIAAKSATPRATALLKTMIAVFMKVRAGSYAGAPADHAVPQNFMDAIDDRIGIAAALAADERCSATDNRVMALKSVVEQLLQQQAVAAQPTLFARQVLGDELVTSAQAADALGLSRSNFLARVQRHPELRRCKFGSRWKLHATLKAWEGAFSEPVIEMRDVSAFKARIEIWLENLTVIGLAQAEAGLTTTYILVQVLRRDVTRENELTVSLALQQLGFVRQRVRRDGVTHYFYSRRLN